MRHFFALGLCALCAMAATASAGQVDFRASDSTTAPNAWSTMYGGDDYMVFDFSSGKPDIDGGYYTKNGSTNPSYVANFYWGSPGLGGGGSGSGGSSSGGGTGSVTAAGDLYYDLVLNEGKSFEFTALFYDSSYGTDNSLNGTDVALRVRLLGYNDLDDDWHEITVAELEHGVFLSWDVTIYDDDEVMAITLDVDYVNGAGAYAAGFFLDNVADAGNAPASSTVPEPATIGLMMFGLTSIFARPKRKR